ncbi:hypothetical protein SALBM311S_08314 [Streptomyces alboniger]
MRAIVVGAGIGGLTAALSLLRAGHEVTLVERTSRFTEVGAGIQLAPNATRVLRRLDLLDAVAAQAARPAHVSFCTWSDGTEICRYTLGRAAEDTFGAPYLQVHRADLHTALAAAVPPGSVRVNTDVVGIDQDDECACVTTAGGERLRADLVVAADGVRSAAPPVALQGADEAVFSRTAAYRALLPAAEVAHMDLPRNTGIWLWTGPALRPLLGTWWGTAQHRGRLHGAGGTGVMDRTGRTGRAAARVRRVGPSGAQPLEPRGGGVPLRHPHAVPATPGGTPGGWPCWATAPTRWCRSRPRARHRRSWTRLALGDVLAGATPAEVPDALDRYVRRRLSAATSTQAASARAGEDFHLPDGPEGPGLGTPAWRPTRPGTCSCLRRPRGRPTSSTIRRRRDRPRVGGRPGGFFRAPLAPPPPCPTLTR